MANLEEYEEYKDVLDSPAHRLGHALRVHRETLGLTYTEISRRMNYAFTPVVLQMVELGRYPLDESQIHAILWGYDANARSLLPSRHSLAVDEQQHQLSSGPTFRELRQSATVGGLLYEYLSFLYELRETTPGEVVPLRHEDLAALANTTDTSIADIRSQLEELMSRWNDDPRSPAEDAGEQWWVSSRGTGARSPILQRLQGADR